MAYIGRDTDKISNVEVLDNITFDGSSSYTLQKNSVNFTPSSANTLLVSINGVVQAGNFTVSGSTIDFGTAVAGTSTCDFILHYGVGLITTPADGTVTTAKLGDSAVTTAKLGDSAVTTAKLNDASVSLAKLTATGTKDATTFLRGDNTFAEAGGGKVLQVLTATDTTERSTSSTSFVTASNTLTITITPSATSSKIFLVTSGTGYQTGGSSKFTIYRGATNLSTASSNELVQFEANRSSIGMTFLDSPSTTSATTYQVYFRNSSGSTTNLNPNDNQSVITAFEIGA
jgi:hypothetical protein